MEINALKTFFTSKNEQPNNVDLLSCKDAGGSQIEKLGLHSIGLYLIWLNYELFYVFTRSPLLSSPFLQNLAEQGRHRPAKPHTLASQFFHFLLHEEPSLFPLNSLLPLNSNLTLSPIRKERNLIFCSWNGAPFPWTVHYWRPPQMVTPPGHTCCRLPSGGGNFFHKIYSGSSHQTKHL